MTRNLILLVVHTLFCLLAFCDADDAKNQQIECVNNRKCKKSSIEVSFDCQILLESEKNECLQFESDDIVDEALDFLSKKMLETMTNGADGSCETSHLHTISANFIALMYEKSLEICKFVFE
jgi:hypothetical protein